MRGKSYTPVRLAKLDDRSLERATPWLLIYNPVFYEGELMNRLLCKLFSAFLLVPAFLFAAQSAPQVKTASGTVEGKDDGTVRSFLGIPYAAPPVGDLRWKAPAPAAKWDGVRK